MINYEMDLSFKFHTTGSYRNNTVESFSRKYEMGIHDTLHVTICCLLLADGLRHEAVQSEYRLSHLGFFRHGGNSYNRVYLL